ncbi:hypothetical protein [Armatimonas sp.]|uniref:hypothetical protein n=1 Tax=Armatimonas sp. TaxID=1872638 RepID=UPI00286A54BA|nr:hypothetical protein [Armatimonas sp.]
MNNLLNFLDDLERTRIYYRLERNRPEAIMVRVDIPGERWEVEFFADGSIEVEVFRSTDAGILSGDEARAALERLLKDGDEEA